MSALPRSKAQADVLAAARQKRLQRAQAQAQAHAQNSASHSTTVDHPAIPLPSCHNSQSSSASTLKRKTRQTTALDHSRARIQDLEVQLVSLEAQLHHSRELSTQYSHEKEQLQQLLSIQQQSISRLSTTLLATEKKLQRNRKDSRKLAKERLRWEQRCKKLEQDLQASELLNTTSQSLNLDLTRKVGCSPLRVCGHVQQRPQYHLTFRTCAGQITLALSDLAIAHARQSASSSELERSHLELAALRKLALRPIQVDASYEARFLSDSNRITELSTHNQQLETLLDVCQANLAYTRSQLSAARGDHRILKKKLLRQKQSTAEARAENRDLRVELKEAQIWKTMEKGAYTPEVRSLVREYVDAGCAQSRVGSLLIATGKAFGAAVSHSISRNTVARAIREAGIASDIQLGMEMALAPGMY